MRKLKSKNKYINVEHYIFKLSKIFHYTQLKVALTKFSLHI